MRRFPFITQLKEFDRDIKLLVISMMSRQVVRGFTQVVITIYYALIGLSPVTIGLLISLSSVVSALNNVLFGVLSDKYGRKLFMLLSALFATMMLLILATSRNIWLLVLGQGLGAMGQGAGASPPAVSGYIAEKIEQKKRVSFFSTIAITNTIAATFGSAIAGAPKWFQNILGIDLISAHSPLFFIGAAFSALSFIILLNINDVNVVREKNAIKRKVFKNRSWNVILKYSLVRSIYGFGWGLIQPLLPLYFFIQFGVGSDMLGPLYATTMIISLMSYSLIPFIVGKLGDIRTISLCRLLTATATVTFSFTKWYPLATGLLVIFNVITSFVDPIFHSFSTMIVEPDETATIVGFGNFARMGMRSVAPTLAGYMFEAISLSMPFLLGSFFTVMNGFLLYIFFRPSDKLNPANGLGR